MKKIESKKIMNFRLIKNLLFLFSAILIAGALIFLFSYFSNQQILSSLEKTQTLNSEAISKDPDLKEANKLFELPDDKLGTFGKIRDIKTLQGKKQYFSKAQDGDLLIIYDDLTIIYDPKTKTIVDISKEKLLK